MKIKDKIIVLRDLNKLTQEEVANALGVSKSTYCRKEKGTTDFTVDELEKLFSIFHVTYSDFNNVDFPVIHKEEIPLELLDKLEQAILDNQSISIDWEENRKKYISIKKALDPVLKKKMESLDFPDIDLSDLSRGTIVKEVLLDVRAEKLINDALEVQARLAEVIFGAKY